MRVPVDEAWGHELGAFVQNAITQSPPPEALDDQVQGVFAAGYHRDLGLLRYAAGAPLGEVRGAFRRSAEYTIAVFRMREGAPWESAPDVDPSLTNSRRALHAMELALAAGARDLAEALARLVWDPPDASYLGPTSVVCTLEEQRLAYALRDLLLGETASDALRALPGTEWRDAGQRARGWGIVSLAAGDPHAAGVALALLHDEHLARVRDVASLDRLDDLLDVPTLAYASVAYAALSPAPARWTLPRDDAFLSLDLSLDLSLGDDR
jgi:hypothetical protein